MPTRGDIYIMLIPFDSHSRTKRVQPTTHIGLSTVNDSVSGTHFHPEHNPAAVRRSPHVEKTTAHLKHPIPVGACPSLDCTNRRVREPHQTGRQDDHNHAGNYHDWPFVRTKPHGTLPRDAASRNLGALGGAVTLLQALPVRLTSPDEARGAVVRACGVASLRDSPCGFATRLLAPLASRVQVAPTFAASTAPLRCAGGLFVTTLRARRLRASRSDERLPTFRLDSTTNSMAHDSFLQKEGRLTDAFAGPVVRRRFSHARLQSQEGKVRVPRRRRARHRHVGAQRARA